MKTKSTVKNLSFPGFAFVTAAGGVEEYRVKKNGLRVLFHYRPDTGVITTNITYLVGARDEARGETGAAHMLEHMLFKPTKADVAAGIDSAAMQFDRETGCILNANTWKDRTTYFFSYPAKYFERALKIEAERMNGVILTDASLNPERSNVLSEFDMRNGDPYFALSVAMVGAAYHSHPYGHETIGYREDIEQYTATTLERFYRAYYRPDNAVMMVVGDIDRAVALKAVKKHFEAIETPSSVIPRYSIKEFAQEGLRRVEVCRPSEQQIVSIGFKHAGFPSEEWFVANALLDVLTSGQESVLHQKLIDTGLATSVDGSLEPTSEENLGTLSVMLAEGQTHKDIETLVRTIIFELDLATITPLLKKTKAKLLTDELFSRDSSLRIVSELTEYVASGHWTWYAKTPEVLESITPKKILAAAQTLFKDSRLTIGYFIGISEK